MSLLRFFVAGSRVFHKNPIRLVSEGILLPRSLVFDFIMSSRLDSSEAKKPVSAPKVVPMMSKITEDKLTGPNYSD